MRSSRTVNPAIALSASRREALASSSIDCSRSCAISGSITLSWKLPDCAASVIVASLPTTLAATMHTASGITGLTLPGMMLEPGCSAGRAISPRPASGPEFIQRKSLPILVSDTAITRSWPDSSQAVSWLARLSKKFGLGTRRSPLRRDRLRAKRPAKRGCALMPVPTAVPPCARRRRRGAVASRRSSPLRTCCAQADSSWSKRSGIASIRWVRPVLTTPRSSRARRSMHVARCASAGRRRPSSSSAAATWMAVGIVSLDDCPRFTSSLGWTARFSAALASEAMTSLAFMLVEVPEPVWNTSTGNWSSCSPSPTAIAARRIAAAVRRSSRSSSALVSAAAALIRPSARMNARGMRRPDTGKLSTARWVWAPHRASAGT